ncbi:MAG: cache domain-containing protein [Proteobacteria bacterium]|nr:cache domain-containing protein [Pseudomonadota bacterium]
MKKMLIAIVMCMFLMGVVGEVIAAGTAAEAEAMVKKAISYYKANGKDKAFTEISDRKGQFVKDDLYVFVYDLNGKCVAHGFNQKMVGKDFIEVKDSDGRFYVKDRIELAKSKGKGWQDYKFTNPLTKKIENKTAYIEKADDYIFGCGAYK